MGWVYLESTRLLGHFCAIRGMTSVKMVCVASSVPIAQISMPKCVAWSAEKHRPGTKVSRPKQPHLLIESVKSVQSVV
jgi:hypothetical protein